MKTLTDFQNALISTGVRLTHQFNLTVITNIPKLDGILGENMNIWADGTSLPGRTQNVATMSYLGYPMHVPSNFTMTQEISFNIRCDQSMLIRDAMLAWLAFHSDPAIDAGSLGAGVKRIPLSTIIIDLYDEKMVNIQHTYELKGVIPLTVGDIKMSHDGSNIATFSFNCKYQHWNSKSINTPLFSK